MVRPAVPKLLCDPTVANGMCNAVHDEVGPLTTVCSPVLIIAAVYAIPTLSSGSWLKSCSDLV